jgi:hypothetical protein
MKIYRVSIIASFFESLTLSNAVAFQPTLPISTVTPGMTNPLVDQSNIQSTICVSGYTKTIRPSSSYTTNLKKQQLATTYSFYKDSKTADFEEDHLIPLELGGHPTSPKNLWPEPYANPGGAQMKDRLENALHALVCNGSVSLSIAQGAIATNWYTAYLKYVLKQNG